MIDEYTEDERVEIDTLHVSIVYRTQIYDYTLNKPQNHQRHAKRSESKHLTRHWRAPSYLPAEVLQKVFQVVGLMLPAGPCRLLADQIQHFLRFWPWW